MRQALSASLAVIASISAFGQTPENLTFEVASVRAAAPPPQLGGGKTRLAFGPARGGPGTSDPGQITWSNVTLKNLLTAAHDVKPYQVSGPAWLESERYDIVAKVPAGATQEQVNVMWRNLLKERFGVVVHHESKEFQVEELQVAKGGPKLKETTIDPNAPPPPPPAAGPPEETRRIGKSAAEMNAPGLMMMIQLGANGPTGRMMAKAQTMSELATVLGNQLDHPVVDKTGLTGAYDFNVEYTPDLSGIRGLALAQAAAGVGGDTASEPGSSLAAAVQQQLGLRLVGGKAKMDVVVVDKAERTPTEN